MNVLCNYVELALLIIQLKSPHGETKEKNVRVDKGLIQK